MIGRMLALAAALVIVLSACGTTGEVKQASSSTFVVSAQYGSLDGSWERAQREATAKARAVAAGIATKNSPSLKYADPRPNLSPTTLPLVRR